MERKDENASQQEEEYTNEVYKTVCDKYVSVHEDMSLSFNGFVYQPSVNHKDEAQDVMAIGSSPESSRTGDRCCGRVPVADYGGNRLAARSL